MAILKIACFCLALFVYDVTALSDAQKASIQAKFLSTGIECLKDHPLSFSDIKTFKQKMIPESKDAKCFAACLFKKIGIMDDMGKIGSSDGAKAHTMQIFQNTEDHKKVEEFIQQCSTVNEQEINDDGKGCERAKLAFNCLVENAPKFGFDVNF